ncbi:fimbrial protein [Enterobacter ludwigii]
MRTKSQFMLLGMMFATGSHYAAADPITVNITGNVVSSPCSLDVDNSNLAVDLGNIQTTELASLGATSTLKPFKLSVNLCPPATTNAILSFGGTEDPQSPGRYLNSGTATNVAVEVLQGSTIQGPGTTMSLPVQADRTATFNLQSRAYAKGQSTPGTIIAMLQATFIYQ